MFRPSALLLLLLVLLLLLLLLLLNLLCSPGCLVTTPPDRMPLSLSPSLHLSISPSRPGNLALEILRASSYLVGS